MLSALTNLVPVLIGPNYNQWEPAMTSYLMSQSGQWRVITTDKDRPLYYGPLLKQTSKGKETTQEETEETDEERGRVGASATAVIKTTADPEEDNLKEI